MHKKLLTILVLFVLLASTLVGCSGVSANPSTLTILSITEGDVFVMKAGTDAWTEATVEMSLEVGDTIKTGDDSGAEITFFDGSTIELEAGTQIEITSLDSSPDTGTKTITLMQTIGTTISRVTKLLDPASTYAIETPTGVAAVRGSVLILTVGYVTPQIINTWATNQEGNISFTAQGVPLQIPEGRTCISTSGQLPELIPLNEPPQTESDDVTDEDTTNGQSEDLEPGSSDTDPLREPPVQPPYRPDLSGIDFSGIYFPPTDGQTPPPDGQTPEVIQLTMIVLSDTWTQVIRVNGSTDDLPSPAEAAWVHPDWSGIDHSFPDDATWIWESYQVEHPVAGDVVDFEKTFTVEGSPVSANLYITCDNGYEVYVNGDGSPAGSAQLHNVGEIGWDESDLTESYVTSSGWQNVESWDVTGAIQPGENTLTIYTANEQMDGADPESNPAGLIFELVITYDTESTGSE